MFWQEDNCPISPFLWRKSSTQIIQHLLNCDCCFDCHFLVAALILLKSVILHHEFHIVAFCKQFSFSMPPMMRNSEKYLVVSTTRTLCFRPSGLVTTTMTSLPTYLSSTCKVTAYQGTVNDGTLAQGSCEYSPVVENIHLCSDCQQPIAAPCKAVSPTRHLH